MGKFYRKKKKNVFGVTIAILLIAVIAGSVLAYFFNSNFKSKVNNVLNIEQEVPVNEKKSENEFDASNLEEINSLKNELQMSELKINKLNNELNKANEKFSEISFDNLIMNGNFTINQKGVSNYTRDGEDIYTVDRWGIFKGNGKFTVNTHTLEGLDETSPTVFGQWIENANLLKGKHITVGATINGERYVKTILLPETYVYGEDYIDNIYECDDFVFRIYFFVDSPIENSVLGVQFLVENGKAITIYDVKVEESAFETRYIERSIAEELALCQRYFQRVNTWSVGYGLTTEKLVFFAPTPTTMRIVGKIVINSAPYIIENGSRTQMNGLIKFNNLSLNGVQFIYTPTEGSFVKYQHYHICTGNIALDGEYYIDFTI